MSNKSVLILIIVIRLVVGCSSNPLDINAENIHIATKFVNLDSVMIQSDSASLMDYHHKFNHSMRAIYDYELKYCLGVGNTDDFSFYRGISFFKKDQYIKRLEKQIEKDFSDLSLYKRDMINGFKHLKFHFQRGKIPTYIIFMNSFFASSAFSTNHEIGIGLERYLGEKAGVIRELPANDFPEWIKKGFDKHFMTRDVLCSWIMTHYVEEVNGNLAQEMVRWGKILYLTQAALPDLNPAVILRYSDQSYQWAMKNEYSFWNYLVNQKILFKSDELTKVNILKDAPFTIGYDAKSPDRMGQFIGFRIIQKYMEATGCNVSEMLNKPYEEILAEYEIE